MSLNLLNTLSKCLGNIIHSEKSHHGRKSDEYSGEHTDQGDDYDGPFSHEIWQGERFLADLKGYLASDVVKGYEDYKSRYFDLEDESKKERKELIKEISRLKVKHTKKALRLGVMMKFIEWQHELVLGTNRTKGYPTPEEWELIVTRFKKIKKEHENERRAQDDQGSDS